MATHSSVLAWRIPGMGEPGGLPSMGSHRVGHDWHDLAAAAAAAAAAVGTDGQASVHYASIEILLLDSVISISSDHEIFSSCFISLDMF